MGGHRELKQGRLAEGLQGHAKESMVHMHPSQDSSLRVSRGGYSWKELLQREHPSSPGSEVLDGGNHSSPGQGVILCSCLSDWSGRDQRQSPTGTHELLAQPACLSNPTFQLRPRSRLSVRDIVLSEIAVTGG